VKFAIFLVPREVYYFLVPFEMLFSLIPGEIAILSILWNGTFFHSIYEMNFLAYALE
jgi:hypothetical protein